MLASLKDILQDARHRRYAVPAFDCVEDVMVRAVIETCESLGAPAVIMGLGYPDLAGNGWYYLTSLVRGVAERHTVPVALHLDHATELDEIKKALDLGFTSVMIDGSRLPFEENIALTRRAVELAHPLGVPVEAELGYVGGANLDETDFADNTLTQPEEVERFVRETEVDALAVSIGTSHGVYRSLPNLDIARLKDLNAASPVPLVLHGGSGTPDDQIREAARHGITKLNFYAENRIAMFEGLQASATRHRRPDPLPRDLFGPIHEKIADVVRQKVQLLGAAGRYEASSPAPIEVKRSAAG